MVYTKSMRGVLLLRLLFLVAVSAINFGFFAGASLAATQTQTSGTTVSGEVHQVDCLGNTINNPSQIIYPYPIVCIEAVNGPVLVEPNLSSIEPSSTPSQTSAFRAQGPFGAVLNIVGIEGSINTVAAMTIVGLTALIIIFVALRAMGLISTRGLSRFLMRRPRLK